MNPPFSLSMQQQSPPRPILLRLPSTPTKNLIPFSLCLQNESPKEMMLVETPEKEKKEFIDTLLEYEEIPKLMVEEEREEGEEEEESESQIMEEEMEEYEMYERDHEGIENKQPNTIPSTIANHNINYSKPNFTQHPHSHTPFKTPNRSSQRSHNSTAHKRKPCTCKKSGCLKKYCQCFKAGEICDQNCDCVGCKNNDPVYAKEGSGSSVKTMVTVCNCKKSGCLKGYCDCHANGSLCSELCNCVECKNMVAGLSDFDGDGIGGVGERGGRSKRKGSKKVSWGEDVMEMEVEEESLL